MCQFLDNLTQRILRKQPAMLEQMASLVPVHRNALETGVLTLAASNPKMVALLSQLLVKTGDMRLPPVPFVAEPAVDYLLPSSSSQPGSVTSPSSSTTMLGTRHRYEASFDDLERKLRPSGRILIGWARVGASRNCLNPRNKQAKLQWRDGDMLLAAIDPKLMSKALSAAGFLAKKTLWGKSKRATALLGKKAAF